MKRFFAILLSALLMASLAGCSGKGKKGSSNEEKEEAGGPAISDTDPPTDAPQNPNSDGGSIFPTSPPPSLSVTLEQKREIYNSLAPAELTAWDKISKCEADGECTHAQAVEQKICHFLGHSCLEERFKTDDSMRAPCGNPAAEEIYWEISQSAELRSFYETRLGEMDAEGDNSFLFDPSNLLKSAHAQQGNIVEITTLDGQFTFPVSRRDPDKNAYRQLNRKKTIDGPHPFDIYYHSSDSAAVGLVEEVLRKPELWALAEAVFEPGIKSLPIPGHVNPTLFLINSPMSNGSQGTLHWLFTPPDSYRGTGYITISTSNINDPARACQSFIRGDINCPGGETELRGNVAHELYHSLEHSYLGNQRNSAYQEAHATWFSGQIFQNTGESHIFYKYFIYSPDLPLEIGFPSYRRYGNALFWDFLSFKSANRGDPVHQFIHCIKDTPNSESRSVRDQCLLQSMQLGETPPEMTMIQFAEALLNIKPSPEGVINLKDMDSMYQDHYKPGAQPVNAPLNLPHSLNPGYITSHAGMLSYEIHPELHALSFQYFPLVAASGNTIDNVHRFTFTGCGPPVACSLFGFKIDHEDRSQYRLLFHHIVDPASPVIVKRATEVDSEPDVVILVMAHANADDNLAEPVVKVESLPFSEPINFTVERRPPVTDRNVDYNASFERATGVMQLPNDVNILVEEPEGYNVRLVTERWNLPVEIPPNLRNMSLAASSIFPLSSGQIEAQIDSADFDGPLNGRCPSSRRTREGDLSGVVTTPLDVNAGDSALLQLTADGYGNPRFEFILVYRGVALPVPYTRSRRCVSGCCTGFRNTETREEESVVVSFAANGPFVTTLAGELNLLDQANPDLSVTLYFSEPAEPPYFLQEEGSTLGGLMSLTGDLAGQLVPPFVDFPGAR